MQHIVCIDDDKTIRKWYYSVLLPQLNNMGLNSTCEIFGEDASSIPIFLKTAMNASLVIIDQHLDYANASFLGSDLAQSLRRDGFLGKSVIYTSSQEPITFFTNHGVDLVLHKGDALMEMARKVMIELE